MFCKNIYFTLSVTHQTFESFVCARHWGLKSDMGLALRFQPREGNGLVYVHVGHTDGGSVVW